MVWISMLLMESNVLGIIVAYIVTRKSVAVMDLMKSGTLTQALSL